MSSPIESASLPPEAVELYNAGCRAMEDGAYGEAASYFRRTLLIAPDWLYPRHNLASALRAAGDHAGAIAAFRAGLTYQPENEEMAYDLSSALADTGAYEEAVHLLDALIAKHPDKQRYRENRAYASWRHRMMLGAHEAGTDHVRILVACMPKSGSTYLADILAALPGMHRAHLVPHYGRREQVLSLEQLVEHRGINYVSQLHLKPSAIAYELMEMFHLRPVFLFRNLWDAMVSLRDHLMVHSLDWSMAQVDSRFRTWDEPRQYEFIARAMMPWFIDFYVSWSRSQHRLALRYEELIADPAGTVARVATWAGLAASANDIAGAIRRVGRSATFNQGGSGRGRAVPRAARAHALALAGFYPDVDFAPLFG